MDITQEQLQSLLAQAAQQGAKQAATMAAPLPQATAAPSPFGQSQSAAPAPTGLLVPLTLDLGGHECRVYLAFGPEAAANPQPLITALGNAGYPVSVYQKKQDGPWGNRNGNGGGYGGGYNRGGYNGGGRRW